MENEISVYPTQSPRLFFRTRTVSPDPNQTMPPLPPTQGGWGRHHRRHYCSCGTPLLYSPPTLPTPLLLRLLCLHPLLVSLSSIPRPLLLILPLLSILVPSPPHYHLPFTSLYPPHPPTPPPPHFLMNPNTTRDGRGGGVEGGERAMVMRRRRNKDTEEG